MSRKEALPLLPLPLPPHSEYVRPAAPLQNRLNIRTKMQPCVCVLRGLRRGLADCGKTIKRIRRFDDLRHSNRQPKKMMVLLLLLLKTTERPNPRRDLEREIERNQRSMSRRPELPMMYGPNFTTREDRASALGSEHSVTIGYCRGYFITSHFSRVFLVGPP